MALGQQAGVCSQKPDDSATSPCDRDCSKCPRMQAEPMILSERIQKTPSSEFVGILGGMGPLATIDLLKKIVLQTDAACDQDHIPILVFADPATPDRTSALLQAEAPSCIPFILNGIERLTASGACVIAIACNTAHYWLPEITQNCAVPVLNMIELTCKRAQEILPAGSTVGILATQGTISAGLYQRELMDRGLPTIEPSREGQANVTRAIEAVKRNELVEGAFALQSAIVDLRDAGANAVVLACTELPILLELIDTTTFAGSLLIDPTNILASECIRLGNAFRERNRCRSSFPGPHLFGASNE